MKRALLLAFGLQLSALAGITTRDAVNAIIGEAGNQDYATQLAVACAIRHRGTLQGVFGLTNPVVKAAGPALRARARRAWIASASLHTQAADPAAGCRYFGSPADARYFARIGLIAARRSGSITFYR